MKYKGEDCLYCIKMKHFCTLKKDHKYVFKANGKPGKTCQHISRDIK